MKPGVTRPAVSAALLLGVVTAAPGAPPPGGRVDSSPALSSTPQAGDWTFTVYELNQHFTPGGPMPVIDIGTMTPLGGGVGAAEVCVRGGNIEARFPTAKWDLSFVPQRPATAMAKAQFSVAVMPSDFDAGVWGWKLWVYSPTHMRSLTYAMLGPGTGFTQIHEWTFVGFDATKTYCP